MLQHSYISFWIEKITLFIHCIKNETSGDHKQLFKFLEVKFKPKYSPVLGMTLERLKGLICDLSQCLFQHYMHAFLPRGWVN